MFYALNNSQKTPFISIGRLWNTYMYMEGMEGSLQLKGSLFGLDFAVRLKQDSYSKMYSISILYCSNCSNNFHGN